MIRIITLMLIVILTGQAQAMRFKIATLSPEGSVWMEKMREGAEELAGQLRRADLQPVSINDGDNLFRVWLGPYFSAAEVESVIRKAIELGFERPHRVQR